MLARLKANANRPLIPSLFLGNVHFLYNKMDLLWLRMSVSEDMRNGSILCFTETCLKDSMSDSAWQISGCSSKWTATCFQGKPGGGLCAFVNKYWCMNYVMINSHCSKGFKSYDFEMSSVLLPHRFLEMFVIATYIGPDANVNNALKELHDNISSLQTWWQGILTM